MLVTLQQQRVFVCFKHHQRKMFDEHVILEEAGVGYPLKQDV